MNTQPENPVPASPETPHCHPAVRKWIYLRALLLGVLVAAWWIMFAPDSMMAFGLKVGLGIAAGLIASGSYLYNLRNTLRPSQNAGTPDDTPVQPKK